MITLEEIQKYYPREGMVWTNQGQTFTGSSGNIKIQIGWMTALQIRKAITDQTKELDKICNLDDNVPVWCAKLLIDAESTTMPMNEVFSQSCWCADSGFGYSSFHESVDAIKEHVEQLQRIVRAVTWIPRGISI